MPRSARQLGLGALNDRHGQALWAMVSRNGGNDHDPALYVAHPSVPELRAFYYQREILFEHEFS